MAVTRYATINTVVNRAAAISGLTPVSDVFSAADSAFTQLTYLLTDCAQELMEIYPWQMLIKAYSYTTIGSEAGELDLPSDFAYMIPQTGWERSASVPLLGPISPQEWTYLLGRSLVGSTVYASFRIDQGKMMILPNDPTPAGLSINYEYISRNLFEIAAAPGTYTDEATAPEDVVRFPPNLIVAMLRMRFLDAKGFDTTKATRDYENILSSWCGKDKSTRTLNASGFRNGRYPYLNGFLNAPDTGYGG